VTTISAKTILRSRNAAAPDKIVSTLLLRYPRWIHAEQHTHRVISLSEAEDFDWEPSTPSLMADPALSRNAGSSRAVPTSKLIDDILADPAIPLFWGANQKGMQASTECDNEVTGIDGDYPFPRESAWRAAMESAIKFAMAFDAAGYHKQIVNRLLEPFSHITVLVSATEWSNFLELRDHADAEPHIAMLAREIRKCLEDGPIIDLQPGQWHLPFVTHDDTRFIVESAGPFRNALTMATALSVARCASTSYKTVDGFDMTLERAIAVHDKLLSSRPIHASPAEHICQADEPIGAGFWKNPRQHGNFVGFRQYRHQLVAA